MILENKQQIEFRDLPAGIRGDARGADGRARMAQNPAVMPVGTMTLEELEKLAIRQALTQTRQNQVQAAKLLGISRDTLRYRMKKFGMMAEAH